MARTESPNATYTDRPQSRRNSGSRSYSEMVEILSLKSPEAQNALEELERGSLKVLNERVKVKSSKDSPFSRACFYLEEVFPEMLMGEENGNEKADAIHKEAMGWISSASDFLDSEKKRVDKLMADGYVNVELKVRNEREYEVSCSSVLYRELVRLVEAMDEILVCADKLRFASVFSVIQRKTIARELHRTVMKVSNRLTSLEGQLHKELVRRGDAESEGDDKASSENDVAGGESAHDEAAKVADIAATTESDQENQKAANA